MVWKSSLSFGTELSASEISSARIVESGTVMITSRKVFLIACRK